MKLPTVEAMKTTRDSLVATCVYMVTEGLGITRKEGLSFPVRAFDV